MPNNELREQHEKRMTDINGRPEALRQYVGEQILATLESSSPKLFAPDHVLVQISDMMAQWHLHSTKIDAYGLVEREKVAFAREQVLAILDEIEQAWQKELPKNMIAHPDNAVIRKIREIRNRINQGKGEA